MKLVGRWSDAVALMREAAEEAPVKGDKKTLASAFEQLGSLCLRQGDVEQAEGLLVKAYDLFNETGNTAGLGKALNGLGLVKRNKGLYREAEVFYKREMEIAAASGDREEMGYAAESIANLCLYQGDLDKALQYFQQSLRIAQRTGDRVGICSINLNIGNVFFYKEDYPRAQEHYQRSLSESSALGYKDNIGLTLGAVGNCHFKSGEHERSREAFSASLAICRELGNKNGLLRALGSLGMLELESGNPAVAQGHLEESLALAESLGDRQNIAVTLSLLWNANIGQNKIDRAGECLDRAISISRELNLAYYIPEFLLKRAETHLIAGEDSKAADLNAEARSSAEAAGRKEVLFDTEFLECRILARKDEAEAIARLRGLMAVAGDDQRKAVLGYELFRLTGSDEDRAMSLAVHRKLYDARPSTDCKSRIDELEKTSPNT